MRILLVNDDGIEAEGLQAAYRALVAAGHDVLACAPDGERSASSHSVNLRSPIAVRRLRMPDGKDGWAVSGTPADSARLGIELFADPPFDMVVSGINNDTNLGFDVNYSGTVGAALEAAGAALPAVACSAEKSLPFRWERDGKILADVAACLASWDVPPGVIVNLNIPASISSPDYAWCPGNSRAARETYAKTESSPGRFECSRMRESVPPVSDPGSDIDLFSKGRVTLTPVRPAGTDPAALERLLKGRPPSLPAFA
ncbi:MAG: 5'/3'-nucleotidase SurE [Deltaproteobacteria bacterium]|jgi:5'-nucleotidase|nr:5'/3'-nucleotidase SurE [Deltaproteobacteria bacterium]